MFRDLDRETAVRSAFVRADDQHRGPVRMNVYDLWKKTIAIPFTEQEMAYIRQRQADDQKPRTRRLHE